VSLSGENELLPNQQLRYTVPEFNTGKSCLTPAMTPEKPAGSALANVAVTLMLNMAADIVEELAFWINVSRPEKAANARLATQTHPNSEGRSDILVKDCPTCQWRCK
jgi:hypothetical protein